MAVPSISTSNALTVKQFADTVYSTKFYSSPLGMLDSMGAFWNFSPDFAGTKRGDETTITLYGRHTGFGIGSTGTIAGNEQAPNIGSFKAKFDQRFYAETVPGGYTMDQQRIATDFVAPIAPRLTDINIDRTVSMVFLQAAGFTGNSATASDGSVATGDALTYLTGYNTTVAPTATRIVRANGVVNDESLGSADKMKLKYLDDLILDITKGNIPWNRINSNVLAVGFISPEQEYDLVQDSSGQVNWLTYVDAMARAGQPEYLTQGGLGGLQKVAEYRGILLFTDNHVPYGVSSADSSEVTTARRAVFFGKEGVGIGSPYGILLDDESTPINFMTHTYPYGQVIGVASDSKIGVKKMVSQEGVETGVAVLVTAI